MIEARTLVLTQARKLLASGESTSGTDKLRRTGKRRKDGTLRYEGREL